MNIRYRPMQAKDVRTCVEHIARHPIIGPRYGKLIEHLPSAIGRVLRDDYVTVTVFEEFQGSTVRYLCAGMAVFVSDDFLREAKISPTFWVGPELVKRITRGEFPLLTESEVRDANSTSGLNLMVWHNTCLPQDLRRIEVAVSIMTAFEETFRGFRLREVLSQADSLQQLLGQRNAGGFYFDQRRGCYGSFPEVDASNFSDEPRYVGITREIAKTHGGSWVGSLFAYGPPQFGFSRAEQRLLFSALADGGTDEELSEDLGISLAVVKKTWRSIYDRVAACDSELLPANEGTEAPIQTRGREKKHRLLAYLRDHPEELRPVSRRLLYGARAEQRS
jgi:hypothetical protein